MKKISLIIFIICAGSTLIYAQSERKLIRKGNKAYRNHEYTDAEVLYKKAKEAQPEMYQVRQNLAASLFRIDNFESSAQEFTEHTVATRTNNETADAFYNLGTALLQAAEYEKSIDAFKETLRKNPNKYDAKYNLQIAQEMLSKQQSDGGGGEGEGEGEGKQQNKENQENKEQKDQQQQQGQDQKLSQEDAERILQALENDEKELQEEILKEKAKAQKVEIEKNW